MSGIPVPSIVVSDALLFTDPNIAVLDELDQCSKEWREALVLATPFWGASGPLANMEPGKLNKPVDLTVEIPALAAASIRFDPDREIRMAALDDGSEVCDANRGLLGLVRRIRVIYIRSLTTVLPLTPNLASLFVEDCRDIDLSLFLPLASLETLAMSKCTWLSDISNLASLARLRTLSLNGCGGGLPDVSPLSSLTQLQALNLTWCSSLTDISPLASLTGLRSLKLGWCNELSDISPLASLTKLQALDVGGCGQLHNILPLAALTGLHTINFEFCHELTNLSPLASLANLTKLNLWGCGKLHDISSIASLTGLRTLILGWCGNLSDISPLGKLTGLQKLDMRGCRHLSTSPLDALPSVQIVGP